MKNIAIIIVTGVLVMFVGIFVWEKYFDKSQLAPEGSASVKIPVQTSPSGKGCASLEIEKYQLANINSMDDQHKKPAEFQADLIGDGHAEQVWIYDQVRVSINGELNERSMPIIVKVFSAQKSVSCIIEEFSFTANIANPRVPQLSIANEIRDAQVLPNFWGDGKEVVKVYFISTAYGSGSTGYLDFLTFKDGKYQLISGPILNELSDYKFNEASAKRKEILVADGGVGWNVSYQGTTQGEAHFDPHLIQVSKYVWDGEKYNQTILGMTKNKYPLNNSSVPVLDQIIKTEPRIFR